MSLAPSRHHRAFLIEILDREAQNAYDAALVGAGAVPPLSESAEIDQQSRELSLLERHRRALALAEDSSLPILERLGSLAGFGRSLDRFFQVHVAGLKMEANGGVVFPDGRTPGEELRQTRARVLELVRLEKEIFAKQIVPELAETGIRFSDWSSLAPTDQKRLSGIFEAQIFPMLTPVIVGPAHPFPYISSLSLNLAVLVGDAENGVPRFAHVKVPPNLPRFLVLPDGESAVPVEQVIAAHLNGLFPGTEIMFHSPFRVTRRVRVRDPKVENRLLAIESGLRRRRRTKAVVRLEIDTVMPDHALALLMEELEVETSDVYFTKGPLDLAGRWSETYDRELDDIFAI